MQVTLYYYENSMLSGLVLVRYQRGSTYMMTADEPVWIKLLPDNSYEREICLGQGDNCLNPITPEEVLEILDRWHFTVRDESDF